MTVWRYFVLALPALAAPVAALALAASDVAAPTAAVQPLPAVAAPSERMICQRQEVIGSLTQRKRVCMTKRNWERVAKNAQDELQILTAPGHFAPR